MKSWVLAIAVAGIAMKSVQEDDIKQELYIAYMTGANRCRDVDVEIMSGKTNMDFATKCGAVIDFWKTCAARTNACNRLGITP